ncbi:MAG: uracil-DNA glycosylase [Chloroflexi bacterium]|nr:uracil-DNA glycosylase [Chloroflexota bacterium]
MPPSKKQIDALLVDLSFTRLATADAVNQYAPGDEDNAIRRANLRLYLRAMSERKSAALLLMEAPGYRGCRLTGIPVTSRKVMLEGLPALNMFGADAGFRDVSDSGFEAVYGEQSATIVWGALADLKTLPFIWNTFPFHPHKAGQSLSNRKPRRSEIELGSAFLLRVLELWRFDTVIAVGNVAQETLVAQGIDCAKVRHPAHGGKKDFVAGLKALLSVGA